MPEISIVVPVYNAKKYLCKCIDSILAQTFTDFELILVDDGSFDGSEDICDEYASKDYRINVIHKENAGTSSARNMGIDIAKGSYIGFIDSDDYIDEDMYEILFHDIKKTKTDLAVCGMYHSYKKKMIVKKRKGIKVLDRKAAIEELLMGGTLSASPVNKLYKIKLFDNVRYPVDCIVGEDAITLIRVLAKALSVVVNLEPKYYYVHRVNSITTGSFSKSDYDIIQVYTKILDFIKKEYPDLVSFAYYRYWWAYFHLINRLALDTEINRKKYNDAKIMVEKKVRNNFFSIVTNPHQSIGKRFAFSLIFLSPDTYMRVYYFWFYKIRSLN